MERTRETKRTRLSRHGESGMTLIEVLIVIAILGLLAAIAFPMYQDQMVKARRSDGQTLLMDMAARMERFYFDNTAYTTQLTALGYSSNTNVLSAEGHYRANVANPTATCPINTCYSLTAEPLGAQTDDSYCDDLGINSLGQKTISGSGVAGRCW